jgi:hypothetical protein
MNARHLLIACIGLLPLLAQAHKPSDAYVHLKVDGAIVEQRFDIALRDLERELALDADDDGQLAWGEVRTRWADIDRLSLQGLSVQADGAPCAPGAIGAQQLDEHSDGRYAVLTRRWTCPAAVRTLTPVYQLFAQSDPTHRGIVRVQQQGRDETAVLVPGDAPRNFGTAAEPAFPGFVTEGLHHILIGSDHILFLLALLLPAVLASPRLRPVLAEVLRVVTAFTAAHSITLALAAFDLVNPPLRWVESVIAASVVFAALNNLVPMVREGRWKLTFAFGLVHGFGFAGALKDAGLTQGALALPLLGFNLGVELGQLAIVAIFVTTVWALRTTRFYQQVLLRGGSALIVLVAVLWLTERAFDIKLGVASAQAASETALPPVEVIGHYLNGVGTSSAASEGSVTARLIANRPALRPAEVLEFVPGLIVTQHSGDGKANQYFLRGFNLDHGTDFASFVDGMPVNMVSHAHGQGYSDLNFLIPELVQRIDYRKGPYVAADGDFASAGTARIALVDEMPRGVAKLTLGEHGYRRALLADSTAVGEGHLLGALELHGNDGPWDQPERLRKLNGWLRYGERNAAGSRSVSLMAYRSRWSATDQIPQRAVDDGSVGRFGTLDPSDGGSTQRLSLSAQQTRLLDDGDWRVSAYAIRSRLNLFSNFTYAMDDPVNGDQFEQAERRQVLGGEASRQWRVKLGGREQQFSLGLQLRQDRLSPVGLYSAAQGQRREVRQESRVRQASAGVYGEWATGWTPWLKSVTGLRADRAHFSVDSSVAGNSGRVSDGIASPKLSLIFGPWAQTEFFANYGSGFHSNDARGTTAATDPVPGLVRSRGAELGLRSEIVPGLQSSLALWRLGLDSELVFVGDAGTTEPNRASRRSGIEWNNHWQLEALGGRAWKGWLLDVDLAASRARFTDSAAEGDHVPGAVNRVVSAGLTWADAASPWFGQFQLRHFGPRDLIEDGSQRSSATTLASLRGGWRATRSLTVNVDVFNLFNRAASDIDYWYESQRAGEAVPVADRHVHPVEPRSVRVTMAWQFR